MSIDKLVLIFALLGSAMKVVEVIAAMIGSAIARSKAQAVAEAKDESSASAPAKVQGKPQQAAPVLKLEDQLARMMVLLESTQLASEEMKDKQADLLSRLEAAEQELATAKAAAVKSPRPRARKSTEGAQPQQQSSRVYGNAPASAPPSAYLADQERFEIVQ